jgi:hypothetical protein
MIRLTLFAAVASLAVGAFACSSNDTANTSGSGSALSGPAAPIPATGVKPASLAQNCLDQAGVAALSAVISAEKGGSAGLRTLRLGMFADQGKDADKQSPYSVVDDKIHVTVSTGSVLNPGDGESQEVHSSSFYEVTVLDAGTCKLSPAKDVSPE